MKNFYEGTEKKKNFGISYVKKIANPKQKKEHKCLETLVDIDLSDSFKVG